MMEQARETAEQQREVIEQAEGAQRPARQPAEQADAPAPEEFPFLVTKMSPFYER
jgi:hypothetical protein